MVPLVTLKAAPDIDSILHLAFESCSSSLEPFRHSTKSSALKDDSVNGGIMAYSSKRIMDGLLRINWGRGRLFVSKDSIHACLFSFGPFCL